MIDLALYLGWSALFALPAVVGFVLRRRRHRTAAATPPVLDPQTYVDAVAPAWCAGCDRLVPAGQMGWSDDGDYRCAKCLGITTSSGWAEAAVQLRDHQIEIRKTVVPPKGGGGVVLPFQRKPHVCTCPDCEAFGPHHDVGEHFPFHDWGSSEPVKG